MANNGFPMIVSVACKDAGVKYKEWHMSNNEFFISGTIILSSPFHIFNYYSHPKSLQENSLSADFSTKNVLQFWVLN